MYKDYSLNAIICREKIFFNIPFFGTKFWVG